MTTSYSGGRYTIQVNGKPVLFAVPRPLAVVGTEPADLVALWLMTRKLLGLRDGEPFAIPRVHYAVSGYSNYGMIWFQLPRAAPKHDQDFSCPPSRDFFILFDCSAFPGITEEGQEDERGNAFRRIDQFIDHTIRSDDVPVEQRHPVMDAHGRGMNFGAPGFEYPFQALYADGWQTHTIRNPILQPPHHFEMEGSTHRWDGFLGGGAKPVEPVTLPMFRSHRSDADQEQLFLGLAEYERNLFHAIDMLFDQIMAGLVYAGR